MDHFDNKNIHVYDTGLVLEIPDPVSSSKAMEREDQDALYEGDDEEVTSDESDYPREETDSEYESNDEADPAYEYKLLSEPGSRSPTAARPIKQFNNERDDDERLGNATEEGDSEVPESMKCVLCLQILLDPASLPCGHTCCHVCLVRMMLSRTTSPFSTANTLCCPMCRVPWTSVPNVNILFR